MTKDEYDEYLKSEHWEEMRKKRMGRDKHKCYLCRGKKLLDVYHIRYENLGEEDVENDIVTLCQKCDYMLYDIRNASRKEYEIYKAMCRNRGKDSEQAKCAMYYLKKRVKSEAIEEFRLRDKSFGGDLDIFASNMKTVKKLLKITRILFPDIGKIHVSKDIRNEFKKFLYEQMMW